MLPNNRFHVVLSSHLVFLLHKLHHHGISKFIGATLSDIQYDNRGWVSSLYNSDESSSSTASKCKG